MNAPRIPLSTYRLQFNHDFTFSQAADLVPYLASLGISHVYASPYLRARPGSMHGYDIIDHHHLNPEIGSAEDYERFVKALHEHGMGQILDIVPNHMGIMGSDNAWWLDVLENGEASLYAEYFDIDWEPLKEELQGKVLVPVLGDQYGIVLDRGELKLSFDKEKGEFSIFYFQHRFPVNPREYPRILRYGLEAAKEQHGAEHPDILDLQSLMTTFRRLPSRTRSTQERRAERARDKEIYKQKLAELCQRSALITNFLERSVAAINGTAGDSASFEELHDLIKAQAYRLAYWRVSADDINYRRFFDVDHLAALRQESELVFQQTHEFVLQLLHGGKIDGLRIDHPDGLYHPQKYFERLQAESRRSSGRRRSKRYYLVAEKILSGEEKPSGDWPIHGTTGYAFSNLVNGLFVDATAKSQLDEAYTGFVGKEVDFDQLLYECKKLVMDRLLNSELNVLANHLSRIALADRHTCDFTLKSLRDALTEIVACFPVYRTYVAGEAVSECDRKYIDSAVDCAKARNRASDLSVYDFIRDVLALQRVEGHRPAYQRSVVQFAMKFQQYTSALMAKGLEDTSFYRYNRLVSLNDVGGNPLRFGVSPQDFHGTIEQRASTWPHEMLATSTHDSKRSEDVRARINVLSELPSEWNKQVQNWRELNANLKADCSGCNSPTLNDEYLLYQTLIGAWPMSMERPESSFVGRIREYMLKAVREAKENTSWRYQNAEYESALSAFVEQVLGSGDFGQQFLPFARQVAFFGMLNSLSQILIKLTAPGVPDTYQGSEAWEFNLVDPDNRRPVDYEARRQVLSQVESLGAKCCEALRSGAGELAKNMEDGRIKMYVIWRALGLRNQLASLFQQGQYIPLQTTGEHADHVVAFARHHENETVVVAVPRLCARLLHGVTLLPCGEEVWNNTSVVLPQLGKSKFTNVFTGEQVTAPDGNIPAGQLFGDFPVALLRSSAE